MFSIKILNSASLYGTLTRKKLIKLSLHRILPLTFASRCLPYKSPAVVIQHIWTPFTTVPFSKLGNILMELFALFIGDSSHFFRNKI